MKKILPPKWESSLSIERASGSFMECCLPPKHPVGKDQQRGMKSKESVF